VRVNLSLGTLRKLIPFRRGKEEEKTEQKREEVEEEVKPPEPALLLADIPRYRRRPRLIFVGSGKGGVGKSLIASNLVIVASALGKSNVYAVDLDLDNYTLSKTLQPPEFARKLVERLHEAKIEDYVNLATVLRTGVVPKGSFIPVVSRLTYACNGAQVQVKYRLVPAYNVLKQREQEVELRSLTPRLLHYGVEELLNYFKAKIAEGGEVTVVFDGKQKSNIGIEYEPLYRQMIEHCDVFLMPVEASALSFSEIVAPYKNIMDKLVLVINKVEPALQDRVLALMEDALDRNIPVFLMPTVPQEGDEFRNQYTPPAARSLTKVTAVYTATIAYFLNLLDDSLIQMYGCEAVYRKLRSYKTLYEQLKRR